MDALYKANMEKTDFSEQPLKYQIEALKLVEEDYIMRSRLSDIGDKVFVNVAGDDLGLIMRQCFNEASRGDLTRAKDLTLLKKRIKELETELEKHKKIDEVQKHCQVLIDAAQRVLGHVDTKGGEDDDKAKLEDHRALEETVTIVWELYEGANIKIEKEEKEVKSNKRRKTKNKRE